MRSSSTPKRRRTRRALPRIPALALGLALMASGCQPKAKTSGGVPARSLLGALELTEVEPGAPWTRTESTVLIDLERQPFIPLGFDVDPEAVPVRPRLEFGQGISSLVAEAPLGPEAGAVLAHLEWSFDLSVPPGALQSELVFLDRAADWSDPQGTMEHICGRQLINVPIESSGRARVQLAATRPERASHVLLVATRATEGPGKAQVRSARAVTPSFEELIATVRQDGEGGRTARGVEHGWFQSQLVYRPGAVVPAGGALRLPVELPPGEGYVEAEVGLLAQPLADTATAVIFEGRFADEPPVTLAQLSLDDAQEGCWAPVRLPWPSGYEGEWVPFEVRARVMGSGYALPVLAAPRLVPDRPRRSAPNLVLFSIDTLRADHLGSYGYERDTSPNMDALAERGLRFADVWAESAYTLPTHTTLFTGQHAAVHGVYGAGDVLDRGRSPLLSERMLDIGHATAAFTGGGFLLPKFGLHEGYERFGVVDVQWNRESSRLGELIGEVEGLTEAAVEQAHPDSIRAWVDEHAGVPTFLFVHTYAPHEFDAPSIDREALGIEGPALEDDPLALAWIGSWRSRPAEAISPGDRRRMIDLYDAGVHQADRLVGDVVEAVRNSGRLEETLFALTSDHGKEIGERGIVEHGHSLQEELLDVPLILAGPGVPGGVSELPAMQVDLVPTLWGLLGLPPEHVVQGRNLLGSGAPEDRPLLAELDWQHTRFAFREGDRKWYASASPPARSWEGERTALEFDLEADPGERSPLPVDLDREERAFATRAALRELGASLATRTGGGRSLDAGTVETLQALGYAVEAGEQE